jgi:uncharacterized NAD-dependent epimerase/dehydratase family protein
MENWPEGNAIVYCQGAYQTTNGKTAHGLVRMTRRYNIAAVVDSECAGQDAGVVLDDKERGIPVMTSVEEAVHAAQETGAPAQYLVMGLAPEGGGLPPEYRQDMIKALELGLNIDSGLHDFLSDDPELAALAEEKGLTIRDIRKPPVRKDLHFFSGKIQQAKCLKLAILGTDSAVGKRTTAWILVDALNEANIKTEMIGTGQTAWMQGARYGIILDSIVNDFVAGELEHAVFSAWQDQHPEVIIVEGQGSLMNPAYPGGFEIMAAARPDAIIIQHAPGRQEYDGFPGYPIHRLEKQIKAIELISEKPVAAVTINHEGLTPEDVEKEAVSIMDTTGLPAIDVLLEGPERLVEVVTDLLHEREED